MPAEKVTIEISDREGKRHKLPFNDVTFHAGHRVSEHGWGKQNEVMTFGTRAYGEFPALISPRDFFALAAIALEYDNGSNINLIGHSWPNHLKELAAGSIAGPASQPK